MRASAMPAVMVGLAALAACADPTFDVSVSYEQLPGVAADDDLRAQVDRLTVLVIDATAAGDALGRDADCEDVALGRIAAAVLEGARRASVTAGDGAQLSGVPRLGAKLVIVEAFTAGGRRVGAGCQAWGEVDGDAAVPVRVEAVPRVRIFARDEAADAPTAPAAMRLVVTATWDDLIPLADRRAIAELHTAAGVVELAVAPTDATGLTRTPEVTLDAPGPAQTLIRTRWADAVLRVPAFVPWPAVGTSLPDGARVTLATGDGARVGPAWVSGRLARGQITAWAAAAIQAPAAGAEQLVVAYFGPQVKLLQVDPVAAPGARALAIWNNQLVTVLAGGWQRLDAASSALEPIGGDAAGSGAATAIQVIPDCDDAASDDGLLVRRDIGGAEAYRAYTAPGALAPADHPLAVLAAKLDTARETLVGNGCMTLDDGGAARDVRVALSRGGVLGLTAWLSTGERVALAGVPTVASYRHNGRWFAAGVDGTIHGPLVSSYKLTRLAFGDATVTGFVTNDVLETELASVPTSLDVTDLDDDGRLDLAAAIPTLIGPRLQVNLGRDAAGEPLISITPTLAGGRQAQNAVVRWEQVDDAGHPELVVMTDEGLDVFCVDVKPIAGGYACASAP